MRVYYFNFFAGIFYTVLSTAAVAVPEAARFGYFQCNSCHASPGGSGLLTAYGRSFISERLTTWHYKNEENPLHGLLPNSEMFLVGLDVRTVHLRTKRGDDNYIKTWRMQADAEAGVHFGRYWLTGVAGTQPRGPEELPDAKKGLIVRGYSARVDLLDDQLLVRAGLFMPKFGLNLVDHTAYVRGDTGLGPDSEQSQVEVTFQSELFEFSAAGLFVDEKYDRKGKSKSGINLSAAFFANSHHRFNLNYLQMNSVVGSITEQSESIGASGVLTVTPKSFVMAEIDRVTSTMTMPSLTLKRPSVASFLTLNYEVYRGIIGFVRHEYRDADLNNTKDSVQRFGPGMIWHPRPHIQFEARLLRAKREAVAKTVESGEGVLHYYL